MPALLRDAAALDDDVRPSESSEQGRDAAGGPIRCGARRLTVGLRVAGRRLREVQLENASASVYSCASNDRRDVDMLTFGQLGKFFARVDRLYATSHVAERDLAAMADHARALGAANLEKQQAIDSFLESTGRSNRSLTDSVDWLVNALNSANAELMRCKQDIEPKTTEIEQSRDLIKNANVAPLPPAHLQARVVGGYYPRFASSGTRTVQDFSRTLWAAGVDIGTLKDVLDFGVGCGRVLRRFAETFPHTRLVGADIDGEAIEWLSENYGGRFGSFFRLPHLPPSSLPDSSFDLAYVVSVFTHLNEEMQFAWLADLRRVTRPGGHLLITVRGDAYTRKLPQDRQDAINSAGIFFDETTIETAGLPDFYKDTTHTKDYIYREWGRYFRIISYEEMGCEGLQDLILLQRSDE